MTIETTARLDQLQNGVRVVSEHMPGVASATVGVWIGAGARHESDAENGLAHFLEHMAFKGTSRRTAREIAEQIEDVGGELNAYTSREATAYHARVLGDDLPHALDILADILRDPLMTDADVALERGVILQEIGQSRDTPDDVIFDWAQDAAFPNQPMGRAILGEPETVNSFTGAQLKDFMSRRYAPDRMVIAAAGAVDHDALLALAERYFGDLAPVENPADAPARYQGGEKRVEKALEQAHVILGVEAPGLHEPDFYAAQIYAMALGGGMSSRLFQEARENRGLCYSIFAQPAHYSDVGFLSVYAGTGGEEVRELLDVVGAEMRAVATEPTIAEIERARAQFRAGLLIGLESSASRCERAARGVLAFGRVRSVAETLAKIDAVDMAAIRAFGEKWVLGAEPTVALYGPVASAPSAEALREAFKA